MYLAAFQEVTSPARSTAPIDGVRVLTAAIVAATEGRLEGEGPPRPEAVNSAVVSPTVPERGEPAGRRDSAVLPGARPSAGSRQAAGARQRPGRAGRQAPHRRRRLRLPGWRGDRVPPRRVRRMAALSARRQSG